MTTPDTTTNTASANATPTMQDQVNSVKAPAAPDVQASASAPADLTASTAPQAPVAESPDAAAKLAEAEKRVKDTQAWGHQKAQEAAKLRSDLNVILNHPAVAQAIESLGKASETKTPEQNTAELELKQAFLDYQESPSNEAAFAKIIKLSEDRGSRKALAEMQKLLDKREAEQAIRQRTQLAKKTIEDTVASVAPDVPIELFWAMADRADAETPPQIQDMAERISWQTDRAISLSRAIIAAKLKVMREIMSKQAAINKTGQAVMPGGGGNAPVAAPNQGAPTRTLAEVIKARQNKMATR
jgi:hypothetical protein